jgi:hypothetical protein
MLAAPRLTNIADGRGLLRNLLSRKELGPIEAGVASPDFPRHRRWASVAIRRIWIDVDDLRLFGFQGFNCRQRDGRCGRSSSNPAAQGPILRRRRSFHRRIPTRSLLRQQRCPVQRVLPPRPVRGSARNILAGEIARSLGHCRISPTGPDPRRSHFFPRSGISSPCAIA